MANLIGRLFVFLVFMLSLGFLALAVGVYANHLNFKSKDPKNNPGIIDQLDSQIQHQAYARDRSKARYNEGYNQLRNTEADRETRQLAFAQRLESLRTGKDSRGAPAAIVTLVVGKDGLVDLNTPGAAIQVRGQPMEALAYYQQQLATRHRDILDEQTKVDEQQTLLATLTTQMQGGPNPMDPMRPIVGLIRQKEIQVDARVRAIAQQEFLKPTLANRFSEAVILLKREKELRERLAQLEKGVTARNDRP